MKAVRNRGKKELLHPIFLECRDHCPSEYWKGVFEDLAHGKYPKQIFISSHSIQSSNRKKPFSYLYRGRTVAEICRDTIDLLMQHTDLISGEEIKQKKDNNEPYKRDAFECWKDIKKKYIKDTLLMEFALRLKRDLTLSYRRTIQLYQTLALKVYTGQLTEIHMENGVITHIDGFEYDQETQTFQFDESVELKPEQVYAAQDYVHHYCRRYLLRAVKIQSEMLDE